MGNSHCYCGGFTCICPKPSPPKESTASKIRRLQDESKKLQKELDQLDAEMKALQKFQS